MPEEQNHDNVTFTDTLPAYGESLIQVDYQHGLRL